MTNTQITALITAIQDGGANTALEVRTVLTAIKNACVLPNEVKWIKMPQGDISTYFVTSGVTAGLGIAGQLYEGWAICNGNNTTTDDSGRTSIAYGTGYTTLGARDGSKDAILVSHTHTYKDTLLPQDTIVIDYADSTEPISTGINKEGCAGDNNNDTLYIKNRTTDATGATGIDKNMQPYVVELKIQRIA
jgi:hypothetical protein